MFVLKNSSVCYLTSNDNYKEEIKCMLLKSEGKDTKLSEGDDECFGPGALSEADRNLIKS